MSNPDFSECPPEQSSSAAFQSLRLVNDQTFPSRDALEDRQPIGERLVGCQDDMGSELLLGRSALSEELVLRASSAQLFSYRK